MCVTLKFSDLHNINYTCTSAFIHEEMVYEVRFLLLVSCLECKFHKIKTLMQPVCQTNEFAFQNYNILANHYMIAIRVLSTSLHQHSYNLDHKHVVYQLSTCQNCNFKTLSHNDLHLYLPVKPYTKGKQSVLYIVVRTV